MKLQIEHRLQQLKSEFETGQKMLADLETQQLNLRETLLRINGAIQVLEELLKEASLIENGKSLASVETESLEIEEFNYRDRA